LHTSGTRFAPGGEGRKPPPRVYTARIVSKLLPAVVTLIEPVLGARKFHHSDLPPALPAWFGSPGSFVAVLLLVVLS